MQFGEEDDRSSRRSQASGKRSQASGKQSQASRRKRTEEWLIGSAGAGESNKEKQIPSSQQPSAQLEGDNQSAVVSRSACGASGAKASVVPDNTKECPQPQTIDTSTPNTQVVVTSSQSVPVDVPVGTAAMGQLRVRAVPSTSETVNHGNNRGTQLNIGPTGESS